MTHDLSSDFSVEFLLKVSKRSDKDLVGRNDGYIKVIVPDIKVPLRTGDLANLRPIKPGDYITVHVSHCTFRYEF